MRNHRKMEWKEGADPRGLPDALFTGKPHVEGLGYAFLFRNYRAGLGKWLSTDPLGYPDGWNQMAYCGNEVVENMDFLGCHKWDKRYGVESDIGLGYWVRLVAECTGDYHGLDITYNLSVTPDSTSRFVAPYSGVHGGNVINDPQAEYSGFSYHVENAQKRHSYSVNRLIHYITLEFDLVITYSVVFHYEYEAVDPQTGKLKVYQGTATTPQQKVEHIKLECNHRKME